MTERPLRPGTGRNQRTLARRLAKVAAWLTLLPFVWLLANRIDVAPSPAALELMTPAPAVADGDNAWLYYIGIDAPEGQDPVALGRRRADAFNQQANASGVADTPASALDEMADDEDEATWPALSVDQSCPGAMLDCLDWVSARQTRILRQRQSHTLPLQRLQTLYRLPRWQLAYRPDPYEPATTMYLIELAHDLHALALARALAAGDQPALAATLTEMAVAVEFWRRVGAVPQDSDSTLFAAAAARTSLQRLATRLADRLDAQQYAALQAPLERIFGASAVVDWGLAQRREFQMRAQRWRSDTPGVIPALRSCLDATRPRCRFHPVTNWLYAEQATLNRAAESAQALRAAMDAAPEQSAPLLAAHAALRSAWEHETRSFTGMLGRLAYNYTGKQLVDTYAEYDMSKMYNDEEAVSRLLALRHQARTRNLAAADMPGFLAGQPAALRNPHSGAPFDWDASRQEISFVPANRYWLRPAARVAWPSLLASGVHACPAPLVVELAYADEALERRVNRFASCGLGNRAHELKVDDSPSGRGRYDALRILRDGERFDISAWQVVRADIVLYERRGVALDGSEDAWLEQPTAANDARADQEVLRVLVTRAEDKPAPAMVSIAAAGVQAQSLLAQIGATAGLRIDGIALAGEARVDLQGDMPAEDALRSVASQSGLQVQASGTNVFLLQPVTKAALPAPAARHP